MPSHVSESIPLNASTCISVLQATDNFKATRSILEALAPRSGIHIFLECTGKYQEKVWKQIEQLSMQDRVTCTRDMADLRELVTQSDLVLAPSPTMPVRTILLEVMLASIPIIATHIEGLDMLIDEETALIAAIHGKNQLIECLETESSHLELGKTPLA